MKQKIDAEYVITMIPIVFIVGVSTFFIIISILANFSSSQQTYTFDKVVLSPEEIEGLEGECGNLPFCWYKSDFTYYYNDEYCSANQLERIQEALNILETESWHVLSFEQIYKDKADFRFGCSNEHISEDGYQTTGLTYTNHYVGKREILDIEIIFYEPDDCSYYPNLEMHEILHGLGFDHKEDRNSIMYAYDIPSACQKDRKFEQDILREILEVYGR